MPDNTNRNGGSNTGFYLRCVNHKNLVIKSNLFLRNENSLGRGIATYNNFHTEISDNYFGKLQGLKNSIVSPYTKALADKLYNYKLSEDEGNFMTCINNINKDVDILIKQNHMDLNTDIVEEKYDDKSGQTLGYNRDHLIYSKGYKNLIVVGNYFKGMNSNMDGGIKFRNGEGLLIHKNILDDQLILMYVQNDQTMNKFKDTEVSSNIFLNRTYTKEKSGVDISKNITQDFMGLFKCYKDNSEISNFTIENNTFISANKFINARFRQDEKNISYDIKNYHFLNNKHMDGEPIKMSFNPYREPADEIIKPDGSLKFKYPNSWLNVFKSLDIDSIDIYSLLPRGNIKYQIVDRKIIPLEENTTIFLDGKPYNNEEITNECHNIFLKKEIIESFNIDSTRIKGEREMKEISSNLYSFDKITPISSARVVIKLNNNDIIDLRDEIAGIENYSISLNNNQDIVSLDGYYLKALKEGNRDIELNAGGLKLNIRVNISNSFENTRAKSSFRLVYNDSDNPRVDFRIGGVIPVEAYDSNARYGVIALPADSNVDLNSLDVEAIDRLISSKRAIECKPVRVLDGYQFAWVITNCSGHNSYNFNAYMYQIKDNSLTLSRVANTSMIKTAEKYLSGSYDFDSKTMSIIRRIYGELFH